MRENIKYTGFAVFEIERMSTGISRFSHSVLSYTASILDWGLDKCWLKSQTTGIWIFFISKPENKQRRKSEIISLLLKVSVII